MLQSNTLMTIKAKLINIKKKLHSAKIWRSTLNRASDIVKNRRTKIYGLFTYPILSKIGGIYHVGNRKRENW